MSYLLQSICKLCHVANNSLLRLPHSAFISKRLTQVCGLKDNKMEFTGTQDIYRGIRINSEKESCDGEQFKDVLERSLKKWTEEKFRGIWFKVNLAQSDWIPILAKNGFTYHHAKNDYVMMYKWLSSDECNIPPYAHTTLGVGAAVINDNDEVLVVSEKSIKWPHLKLPGGYVEPGENIADAAMREVFEETNIKTEFVSILGLRHAHGGQFGCSDLYIVVNLKPTTLDIVKCEKEIEECKWMPIKEYLTHPDVHELNRFVIHKYLEGKRTKIKIDCVHGIHQILNKPYTMYHISQGEPQSKM